VPGLRYRKENHVILTIPSELLLLAEQRPEAVVKTPPKSDPAHAYFRVVWRALLLGQGEEAALAEGARVAARQGVKVANGWPKAALETRMVGDYNRVAFDRVNPEGWHLKYGRARFEGEPELVVRRDRVANVYVNRPFPEQQKPDALRFEAQFLGVLALDCVPTPDPKYPLNEAMVFLRTRTPAGVDSTEAFAVVRGGGAYFDVKRRLMALGEVIGGLLAPETEGPAEGEAANG
jgi:hypothetical protein